MIDNHQQCKTRECDMNNAPGAHNEIGAALLLQRLYQGSASCERFIGTLKIGLFSWCERGQRRWNATVSFKCLHIKSFKWLRLARAQPLDGIFQFQNIFINHPCDTRAVGAGILRDDPRLPCVEQPSDDPTYDKEDEGKQRARSPVGLRETTGGLAIIVQNMRIV